MKKPLFFIFIFFSVFLFSQTTEDAWIFLKDKPNSETFLANPLSILSERAIDRRNTLHIELDEKDAPIEISYYNQLKNDAQISILGKSKWMNAIHIQATEAKIRTLFATYSFIEKIEFANKSLNSIPKKNSKKITPNHHQKLNHKLTDFNYGSADNQIKMLKGNFLHEQGFSGENQIIAVMDSGFPNVNTLTAFQRIRDNNQILGGYNFADRNDNFYTRDSHGTHVLSTIAGYVENQFVGTAPDAKFYLFITEIVETETVLEETLWVEAAEKADSLGVNVINTSLGYTTFDNPAHNYSYSDLDGNTTFISRGATIAVSRGLLVVNAAGNSGNDSWKYIGAPADTEGVIAVGAVTSSGNISSFSSFGPSFDNRIKPEIVAQGQGSAIISFNSGVISAANGTSFSSPIMAGLITCLNQLENMLLKSSNKTIQNKNDFLKMAVFESAHLYNNPNERFGYGIPNFEIAFNNYYNSITAHLDENPLMILKVIPNPVVNSFKIQNLETSSEIYSLQIFNILGKKVLDKQIMNETSIDISNFKKGIYFVRIFNDKDSTIIKILKE